MKAPQAQQVLLESELLGQPVAMQKDDEGVWSVRLTDGRQVTFKYCFLVDGTQVADPSNMYLSPDRGFKYSVASNPASPYNWASMGDIRHGRVSYDLNRQRRCYPRAPVEGQPLSWSCSWWRGHHGELVQGGWCRCHGRQADCRRAAEAVHHQLVTAENGGQELTTGER